MDNADNREDLEDLEVGLAHAVVAVLDDRAASATAHRMLPLSTAEHLTSHALQAGEAAAAALTEASVASGMYTLGFRRPFDEHITLSDILGPPDTLEPGEAMQREHCGMADSDMQFIAENYKVDTTSCIEYHFVTEPESGLSKLGLVAWPAEVACTAVACPGWFRVSPSPHLAATGGPGWGALRASSHVQTLHARCPA